MKGDRLSTEEAFYGQASGGPLGRIVFESSATLRTRLGIVAQGHGCPNDLPSLQRTTQLPIASVARQLFNTCNTEE